MKDNTTGTNTVENVKYDHKYIAKLIHNAMEDVPGILGPHSGLVGNVTNSLRNVEDVDITEGVHFKEKDGVLSITAKIIAEAGANVPDMAEKVTEKIKAAIDEQTGLFVEEVDVEVADTMTKEEYEGKFRAPKGKAPKA